ncbi:NAD-dependent succinate-semialdehyde dehydrogenase [Curvibacter sp. RS43]|uniref:NAD-dependent succinate-semialdehyde dehydrogenase n=1 Tax=Curvibacter microcysteis TaxID=3026419 RepID=A0ABT5MD91_9BURK|nr:MULTISPECIES: NAD-dependent succinate-semialdehyde dehydrogenase [unclassified Curvibacter]MDD0809459.1 NAD-dependent succinate-semialdehyde dehydrogenase [Curvibacter sp. RS43]MDD0814556.1 NAD-dependent succinate-semialdehyde dehydrogenase [Curvibacter sp. HBC28]
MHSLTLSDPSLLRAHHFINGQWVAGQAGQALPVHNPALDPARPEALIAQVPDGDAADAQAALDAACAAFKLWRVRPAKERAQALKRWHALLLQHQDDLARLISLEQGKPLAEARGEVLYGASYIEWFAEEATRVYGDMVPAAVNGRRMMVLKEPVGVVAAITPWNFPLAMIARKIAPALAAGCCVVAKPAEDTPLTALALARLGELAGFPPGVLNVVTASRQQTPAVVDVWLASPEVRKITFTGSTPVGQHLARASADTLKKLSLELGGNAPFIVFEDADLDAAVDGVMAAKFRNGGQTCVCPNRIYVQRSVQAAFSQKLAARVAALPVGPAQQPASLIGPMINARAVEKIERHVQDALAKGARLETGGQRLQGSGLDGPHYYAPTVLSGVTPDMVLTQEETFGPVAPLFTFDTEDEVIALANDTPFGLAAYFYSQNVRRIWRVASALESGIVGINEGAVASEAAPFGGVKASGYGREGSRYGLDDYLHTKYLCQGQLD